MKVSHSECYLLIKLATGMQTLIFENSTRDINDSGYILIGWGPGEGPAPPPPTLSKA